MAVLLDLMQSLETPDRVFGESQRVLVPRSPPDSMAWSTGSANISQQLPTAPKLVIVDHVLWGRNTTHLLNKALIESESRVCQECRMLQ